ncbi:TadE/TadG family type IV pilus assembly protein [Kitasatospora sp. NPDC054939]
MSLSLAIVFPVVLALVLLVVQGSMWWYHRQLALTAAREGADAGRVQGRSGAGEQGEAVKNEAARRQAADFLARQGVKEYSISLDGSNAEVVRVTVRVTTPGLLPGVTPAITQHVEAPRERFVPPPGSGA